MYGKLCGQCSMRIIRLMPVSLALIFGQQVESNMDLSTISRSFANRSAGINLGLGGAMR